MLKWVLGSVFAVVLFAGQGALAGDWSVGATGGLNVAKLRGEDSDSLATETRTGAAVGLYAQGKLNDKFGFRVGALYSQKGATDVADELDLTVALDYIEFPILAMAFLPAGENGTISFFAGPSIAFNTRAEIEATEGDGALVLDIKDGIKSIDIGGTIGVGVEVDTGKMMIGASGSWTYGFSSVDDMLADVFEAGDTQEVDIKNSALTFLISVGFPIGR